MSAANGAGTGPVPSPGTGLRGGLGGIERTGDLRSAELVSRLLAATPPYLYNMPLVPHSFFFSEMLRSFVHAKNNNESNRLNSQGNLPASGHRRSRKRSWNQNKVPLNPEGSIPKQEWPQRPELWNNRSLHSEADKLLEYEEKKSDLQNESNKSQHFFEKPLELTTNKNIIPKHMSNFKYSEKLETNDKHNSSPEVDVLLKTRKSPKLSEESNVLKEEKYQGNTPTTPVGPSLSLPPPPPPLWYPSLYPPPYGMDPLNFFIDLRVSGHIYDRKHGGKETQNLSAGTSPQEGQQEQQDLTSNLTKPSVIENNNLTAFKDNVKFNRHVSAFSLPKPRDPNAKIFPINLCHNSSSKFNMKYYDDMDANLQEKHALKNMTGTNYVMQNLKRIYSDLSNYAGDDDARDDKRKTEQEIGDHLEGANDSEPQGARKKRRKDVRGVIGLELVVDYMKTDKKDTSSKDGDESDYGRDSSSDVEVLGEQQSD